jgi:hypothetical protein
MAPSEITHQSALIADIDVKSITRNHQTLQNQHATNEIKKNLTWSSHNLMNERNVKPWAVCDQAIAFHLTKTKSTVTGSTLCRLPSKNGSGSLRTCVHLVHHHVLQLLIVDLDKKKKGKTIDEINGDKIICCRLPVRNRYRPLIAPLLYQTSYTLSLGNWIRASSILHSHLGPKKLKTWHEKNKFR